MAYVLSSVSGNLISAASAGYAPTNSGDVSAIASVYQVVSATGTKLYNGTYYLTSVNDNQLSAKYAVSASSATAAFYARYDRKGGVVRSLSSLPGSAEVSAIASAYAESAASGKQDTLTFGYNTADQISSIDGSALGGMDEAAVSGIASAYAESAVSGKADSSALSSYVPYSSLEYNTASAISGINGSALAAGSTYSAGEGIDITDDVISVETPVDVVAGPGIVIDNPDGNTLRVSMAADYETVLWEDATGTSQSTSCTCSEALTNFELVRITFKTNDQYKQCAIYPGDSSGFPYSVVSTYSGTIYSKNSMWSPDADHLTLTRAACTESNNYGTINNTNAIWIVKVVGIHRIANN